MATPPKIVIEETYGIKIHKNLYYASPVFAGMA